MTKASQPRRQVRPEALVRQLSEDNASLRERLLLAYDDLLMSSEMVRQLQAELAAVKPKDQPK